MKDITSIIRFLVHQRLIDPFQRIKKLSCLDEKKLGPLYVVRNSPFSADIEYYPDTTLHREGLFSPIYWIESHGPYYLAKLGSSVDRIEKRFGPGKVVASCNDLEETIIYAASRPLLEFTASHR